MRLAIGATLGVTIIGLLALTGIFGNFPSEWEWVGVVLAVAGLAVAFPQMLQQLLGAPQLTVEPNAHVEDDHRLLSVFIKNSPLTGVAKRLGLKRDTIESLTAHFQIVEAGSGTVVVPIRHCRIRSDADETDAGRQRIALPPTYSVGASAPILLWDPDTRQALVAPDRLRQDATTLPVGLYRVLLIFVIDGQPKKFQGRVIVGTTAGELLWTPNAIERVT